MAKKEKKKPLPLDFEEAAKSEWEALGDWVKENPVLAAALTIATIVCIIAGLVYRGTSAAREQRATTQFARALAAEEPALRASQLAPLAEGSGRWAAEALYMMGESAYEAKDYAKAKEAFEKLRQAHADAPWTPDAVEGLGFIAENGDDYKGAEGIYEEVQSKWSNSFAAMRQDLNIGRCKEQLGDWAAALKSYEKQVSAFPDSSVSAKAQESLDRLKAAHPELFPKAEAPAPETAVPLAPQQGAAAAPATPPAAENAPDSEAAAPAPAAAQP